VAASIASASICLLISRSRCCLFTIGGKNLGGGSSRTSRKSRGGASTKNFSPTKSSGSQDILRPPPSPSLPVLEVALRALRLIKLVLSLHCVAMPVRFRPRWWRWERGLLPTSVTVALFVAVLAYAATPGAAAPFDGGPASRKLLSLPDDAWTTTAKGLDKSKDDVKKTGRIVVKAIKDAVPHVSALWILGFCCAVPRTTTHVMQSL
jgi:hypothetical protein